MLAQHRSSRRRDEAAARSGAIRVDSIHQESRYTREPDLEPYVGYASCKQVRPRDLFLLSFSSGVSLDFERMVRCLFLLILYEALSTPIEVRNDIRGERLIVLEFTLTVFEHTQ